MSHMALIWTSWTLEMYWNTNLRATKVFINISSRKDFSYSWVEIESKQCFNSSSHLAPIHPKLKAIHGHTWSSKPHSRTRYIIKSRAWKKVLSVFVRSTWEREVLKWSCAISWAEPVPRASVPCGGSSPPSPATLPIFWSIFLPIFSSHFLPNIFLPLPFSSSATILPIFFSCSNFSYLPSLLLGIHSAYF